MVRLLGWVGMELILLLKLEDNESFVNSNDCIVLTRSDHKIQGRNPVLLQNRQPNICDEGNQSGDMMQPVACYASDENQLSKHVLHNW